MLTSSMMRRSAAPESEEEEDEDEMGFGLFDDELGGAPGGAPEICNAISAPVVDEDDDDDYELELAELLQSDAISAPMVPVNKVSLSEMRSELNVEEQIPAMRMLEEKIDIPLERMSEEVPIRAMRMSYVAKPLRKEKHEADQQLMPRRAAMPVQMLQQAPRQIGFMTHEAAMPVSMVQHAEKEILEDFMTHKATIPVSMVQHAEKEILEDFPALEKRSMKKKKKVQPIMFDADAEKNFRFRGMQPPPTPVALGLAPPQMEGQPAMQSAPPPPPPLALKLAPRVSAPMVRKAQKEISEDDLMRFLEKPLMKKKEKKQVQLEVVDMFDAERMPPPPPPQPAMQSAPPPPPPLTLGLAPPPQMGGPPAMQSAPLPLQQTRTKQLARRFPLPPPPLPKAPSPPAMIQYSRPQSSQSASMMKAKSNRLSSYSQRRDMSELTETKGTGFIGSSTPPPMAMPAQQQSTARFTGINATSALNLYGEPSSPPPPLAPPSAMVSPPPLQGFQRRSMSEKKAPAPKSSAVPPPPGGAPLQPPPLASPPGSTMYDMPRGGFISSASTMETMSQMKRKSKSSAGPSSFSRSRGAASEMRGFKAEVKLDREPREMAKSQMSFSYKEVQKKSKKSGCMGGGDLSLDERESASLSVDRNSFSNSNVNTVSWRKEPGE